MKLFIVFSLLSVISFSTFASNLQPSILPDCKDRDGSVIPNTPAKLNEVMNSRDNRPQVIVTGVVTNILPEDHKGLPHQKYTLSVNGKIKLLIVSNLDFGRVPVTQGKTVSVCGEFKKVGQGMVHWTHADPHGGHPDGFTIVDGKSYGETETSENY
jgi:hypothetical protein